MFERSRIAALLSWHQRLVRNRELNSRFSRKKKVRRVSLSKNGRLKWAAEAWGEGG
jgi:hypothetical protein